MQDKLPGGLVIHAVVTINFVAAAAIIGILFLRPNQDNTPLIVTILGFLGPTIAALLALAKTIQTGAAVDNLKVQINGRLSQLLEQTERAAKAEGRQEGTDAAAAAATAAAVPAAVAAVVPAVVAAAVPAIASVVAPTPAPESESPKS